MLASEPEARRLRHAAIKAAGQGGTSRPSSEQESCRTCMLALYKRFVTIVDLTRSLAK
jgi:hypothetical protein